MGYRTLRGCLIKTADSHLLLELILKQDGNKILRIAEREMSNGTLGEEENVVRVKEEVFREFIEAVKEVEKELIVR